MVDVVLWGVWVLYCINHDEGDESDLSGFSKRFCQCNFSEICKESRLSSRHVGVRNIPSDVSYDDKKHYQVLSENRRIQNPFKRLRWSVFL